jgi:hypothetical protein
VGKRIGAVSRAVLVTALLATAAGCIPRPVGDFGRADPSWTHDEAMPTIGKWRAGANGEPVSNFNLTDQEDEMHNRIWRFIIAPHANDWFFDAAVELQRTRISQPLDRKFGKDRYYNWLKSTRYESSRVRYATVGSDVDNDIATVPGTFAAICAVIEVDRQRAIGASVISSTDAMTQSEVIARKAENDQFIDWFIRALRYRYDSYNYALDRLLVETPHEEGRAVDARLAEMDPFVRRAEAYDFCSGVGGGDKYAHGRALPSRTLMTRDMEVVDQK